LAIGVFLRGLLTDGPGWLGLFVYGLTTEAVGWPALSTWTWILGGLVCLGLLRQSRSARRCRCGCCGGVLWSWPTP
jgi:hypothetical protein